MTYAWPVFLIFIFSVLLVLVFIIDSNEGILLLATSDVMLDLNFLLIVSNVAKLIIKARLSTYIAFQVFTYLLITI